MTRFHYTETDTKIHKTRLNQRLIVWAFALIATAAEAAFGADLTVSSFSSFDGQTNIRLQASGSIIFSGGSMNLPALPPGASNGQLSVQAGNNIVVPQGVAISAGPGWSVSFLAGANLSAQKGSMDNHGRIIANGGSIRVQAANINQGGLIQADSAGNHQGNIQLFASENIQLASTSVIQANGVDEAPSAGGKIVIKSGGTFSDNAGSQIKATGGANGGDGGNVEVSAPGILCLNSSMDTIAQQGYTGGQLLLDPTTINLSASGTGTVPANGIVASGSSPATLNLNVSSAFIGFSQITLQATGNITLATGTIWNLSTSTGNTTGLLTIEAGGNIVLDNGSMIQDTDDWSVTLEAGYNFTASEVTSGTGTVTLSGNGMIETAAGNITVLAGNSVTLGGGGIVTGIANGAVISGPGGNINVQALSGNVNCGTSTAGYTFTTTGYAVNPGLGGISTASGGNVNIQSGGNITAPLPVGNASSQSDYGSGSFGAAPGNVTLTAGGNVTGHYSLANGTGAVTANEAGTSAQNLALSLIEGEWMINAADSIFLQEVRNPNGMFNNSNLNFKYLFNYDPMASVVLGAGNGVTITGSDLPRITGADEPLIFPPSLTIEAGGGGITLDQSLSSFPSMLGTLDLTTTNGGNLSTSGTVETICVSDSSSVQWANSSSFTGSDQSGDALLHLNDPNPVQINISGSISYFTLYSPKPVEMYVTNSIIESSATILNLSSTNTSVISAGGEILDYSDYVIVTLANGEMPNFDALERVSEPYILDANSNSIPNPNLIPALENQQNQFSYDPSSGSLLYQGTMSVAVESALFTMTTPFLDATTVEQIYIQSQSESATTIPGYSVAGPGTFQINAASIDLGNSGGLVSLGIENYPALAPYASRGADIDISVSGTINMIDSAIESAYGGNINVTCGGTINVGSVLVPSASNQRCLGIVSLWSGDINVIVDEDVNFGGSRIAAYDGGNVVVESLDGNVNVGSGCGGESLVQKPYLNGQGNEQILSDVIPGGGLMATSFPQLVYGQTSSQIGNLTVSAAQEIQLGCGAIVQVPLGSATGGRPSLTLQAGGPLVVTGGSCNSSVLSLSGSILSEASPVISATSPPYVFDAELNVTNLTAEAGSNVQFTVTDGSQLLSGEGLFMVMQGNNGPALIYDVTVFNCQWFKNGTNLPGATDTSLSLTNVQRADAGTYSVVVSTPSSETATNAVQLRVLVPQIMGISSRQTNTLSVSFSAADGEPLTAADIPSFVIQTSTNLEDWTPANLPLSTNANGSLSFIIPPFSSNSSQGFYRILSQ